MITLAFDIYGTLIDPAGIAGDPGVYRHFLSRAGAMPAETWLASGNPFDVIGARSAGFHAAWIRRSPEAAFDPWGPAPTVTAGDLPDFAGMLPARSSGR